MMSKYVFLHILLAANVFLLSHPLVQGHCARLSALLLMVAAGVHGSDGSDGSLSRVA